MALGGLSILITFIIHTAHPVIPDIGWMRMIHNLAKYWKMRRASRPFYPAIAFTDEGVVWGAGTVLARMRADPSGIPTLIVDGDHDRIIALVAATTRRIPPGLTRHFQAAAAQWRRGNKVQANFHLAFARLPRLDGPDDAFHLFTAEQFLFAGFSPALLMQELGFEKSQIALLKFPGQPRVPAGSGKPSGEYSSGQQGDAATVTPAFRHPSQSAQPERENARNAEESVGRDETTQSLIIPVSTAGAPAANSSPEEVRARIAKNAASHVGSLEWEGGVDHGRWGTAANKCNLFVYDMLTEAGASPGLHYHELWSLHPYPPSAGEWADAGHVIPGWRVLGPNEEPEAGDVVAQPLNYADATGHVMIVGPNHTVIGTGDSNHRNGIIEQIPEPDNLGPLRTVAGPKVYRRWTP